MPRKWVKARSKQASKRQGPVCPGVKREAVIRWTNTYTGEEIANGVITSNMEGSVRRLAANPKLGDLDQTIILVPKPRHFGGYQWYFVCPVMNRCCIGAMDAFRSQPLLQPSGLGQASRLRLSIC